MTISESQELSDSNRPTSDIVNDLGTVQNWLDAKGYSEESLACLRAMDRLLETDAENAKLHSLLETAEDSVRCGRLEFKEAIERAETAEVEDTRLCARIAQLEEALRPFALSDDEASATVGDLRRAHRVLAGEGSDR